MASWRDTDDDRNPDYMFQMIHTDLLCKAARGEIDLQQLAKDELASRGLDWSGKWVGFARAGR